MGQIGSQPAEIIAPQAEAPSRDELRRGEIQTEVAPAIARSMIGMFVLIIGCIPVVQGVLEWRRDRRIQAGDVLRQWPTRESNRQFEDAMETASVARAMLRPMMQYALVRLGYFGNSSSIIGRDGRLYYEPGIEHAGGRGFLDADFIRQRVRAAARDGKVLHADPRPAIFKFQRDLAEQGIRLVIVPIPDKAAVFGDNPDYGSFIQEMRTGGVDVFEMRIDGRADCFLTQDTHWRPEWMQHVAEELARHIQSAGILPPSRALRTGVEEQRVARLGDLVQMLGLPDSQDLYRPESVEIQQVRDAVAGSPIQPSRRADVLLLGDSFANVYSDPLMGWGESAGLPEQLSRSLGREIDLIALNNGGASGAREELARELGAGRDRLAGKRVVVWEFAARELSCGDWRPVDLKLGGAQPRSMLVPDPGKPIIITGVVGERSIVPQPGRVPYRDHIMSIHVLDIRGATRTEAMVYLWSMRENRLTQAARLRVGQSVRLKLSNWDDVAAAMGRINRSELSDPSLLASPCWGEVMP